MKYAKRFIAAMLLFISTKDYAQRVQQGYELIEILKVSEFYRTVPNLSFSVNYTYADSAYPGTPTEDMTGQYKLKDGMFWMSMDSLEFIQGDQLSIAVFKEDSMISISEKSQRSPVLKLPLLDSLFQAANVDSMEIITENDSTNTLKVVFKPDSYYISYQMKYDKNQYLIRSLKYYVRDYVDDSTLETHSGTAIIEMSFSSYSENKISPDYFREDKYVYKQDGEYYVKPSKTGFRLSVNKEN